MSEKQPKFKMSLSLNVLNHLGINLYSSTPAVLSEIVANAWDADAEEVDIQINNSNGEDPEIIVITDNGNGMTEEDINKKFLRVGYQRRKEESEGLSENKKRKVMGRKGIGKLSLLSIADVIEVHSVKNEIKSGFILDVKEIKDKLNEESNDDKTSELPLQEIDKSKIEIKKGTRIILRELNKKGQLGSIRKNLARRFSNLDSFKIKIDGKPISHEDREYFKDLQYLWGLGDGSEKALKCAKKAEKIMSLENTFEIDGSNVEITGWVGTFKESGATKGSDSEDLNTISLFVRGKLAQDDILSELGNNTIAATYIIGEIHADFLDEDDQDDIATSSRQKISENASRYQGLKKFLKTSVSRVSSEWGSNRGKAGLEKARENLAIKEWFEKIGPDRKKIAESLFGQINRIKIAEEDKPSFYAYAVLAIENLVHRELLSSLEDLSPESLKNLAQIFQNIDLLEATAYYDIAKERLEVINVLNKSVDENALENVIQHHLFQHLWLLDPSWERATDGSAEIEKKLKDLWEKDVSSLSKEEKLARVDIAYKKVSGAHVIVELKRPSEKPNVYD
ncbi:MAG: ATP-binding protein, partial [Pirellulaceae bacterium]|nr:ATP-binding protein [Pirellulaceae bacterium]